MWPEWILRLFDSTVIAVGPITVLITVSENAEKLGLSSVSSLLRAMTLAMFALAVLYVIARMRLVDLEIYSEPDKDVERVDQCSVVRFFVRNLNKDRVKSVQVTVERAEPIDNLANARYAALQKQKLQPPYDSSEDLETGGEREYWLLKYSPIVDQYKFCVVPEAPGVDAKVCRVAVVVRGEGARPSRCEFEVTPATEGLKAKLVTSDSNPDSPLKASLIVGCGVVFFSLTTVFINWAFAASSNSTSVSNTKVTTLRRSADIARLVLQPKYQHLREPLLTQNSLLDERDKRELQRCREGLPESEMPAVKIVYRSEPIDVDGRAISLRVTSAVRGIVKIIAVDQGGRLEYLPENGISGKSTTLPSARTVEFFVVVFPCDREKSSSVDSVEVEYQFAPGDGMQ